MKIKHTIAGKLIGYFAAFLLLYALMMGIIFSLLLTRQTTALHKLELEQKAVSIAGTLSGFMSTSDSGHKSGGHGSSSGHDGYNAYMRFLDDIAMTDVWVMDESSQLITFEHGSQTMDYADLPGDAGDIITQALSGRTAFSENFSDLLGVRSITAGAPITAPGDNVLGVVLLHAPVDGIGAAVTDGLSLMAVSMILALLLAAAAAVALAMHFTEPLRRMKNTATLLIQGQYTAQTAISRKDEIGDLAATLDQLAGRLDTATQESVKLERMRQDFVANISHELRTPVTVLRGSLEALCDGVVTEPAMVEEYHSQMLSDSLYLERLVNDLLELSRLQNTDFVIEKSLINLCDVMQDVARSMNRVAHSRQIPVQVESALPVCMMTGDYGRLRQMLLTVVDNAVKFSDVGGTVTLRLEPGNYDPHTAVLSVIDRGVVIPPEELPYVFERFHKSRDERNKKGTGLGLPIAKQIAQRHGILLEAASGTDATVFRFLIPEIRTVFTKDN